MHQHRFGLRSYQGQRLHCCRRAFHIVIMPRQAKGEILPQIANRRSTCGQSRAGIFQRRRKPQHEIPEMHRRRAGLGQSGKIFVCFQQDTSAAHLFGPLISKKTHRPVKAHADSVQPRTSCGAGIKYARRCLDRPVKVAKPQMGMAHDPLFAHPDPLVSCFTPHLLRTQKRRSAQLPSCRFTSPKGGQRHRIRQVRFRKQRDAIWWGKRHGAN